MTDTGGCESTTGISIRSAVVDELAAPKSCPASPRSGCCLDRPGGLLKALSKRDGPPG